jgi:hypothetical protein
MRNFVSYLLISLSPEQNSFLNISTLPSLKMLHMHTSIVMPTMKTHERGPMKMPLVAENLSKALFCKFSKSIGRKQHIFKHLVSPEPHIDAEFECCEQLTELRKGHKVTYAAKFLTFISPFSYFWPCDGKPAAHRFRKVKPHSQALTYLASRRSLTLPLSCCRNSVL